MSVLAESARRTCHYFVQILQLFLQIHVLLVQRVDLSLEEVCLALQLRNASGVQQVQRAFGGRAFDGELTLSLGLRHNNRLQTDCPSFLLANILKQAEEFQKEGRLIR